MPTGHVLSKVLEHGQQHGVSSAALAGNGRIVVFIVLSVREGAVFHQQEFVRLFQELPPLIRNGNETVILNVLLQEMQDESLMDNSRPEAYVMVLSGAKQLQSVVLIRLDHGVGNAGKHIGQVLHLEMLRQGLYEFYHQAHVFPSVETGLGMQAIVAGAAVVRQIIFPEVIEQQLPAALAGFCIGHRFVEELLADFLLRHRFPLHELLQLLDVLIAIVRDTQAFLPVPSGATGFLIIAFYALGNIVMDNEADVRLVYTHAEGNGGHNHIHFLRKELVLIVGPGFGIQPGMIRKGADAIDTEELSQFFHLFAAKAVDDAGLAGVLPDKTDDILFRFHLVPYLIIQIGPIEGRAENLGVLDAQVLENVALHLGCGGGREGDDWCGLDFFYDRTDLPVFRAEVVPPFGDTVSFVHGIERDPDFLEQIDVLLLGE